MAPLSVGTHKNLFKIRRSKVSALYALILTRRLPFQLNHKLFSLCGVELSSSSTVALYRPAVKEESAYHQFCSSSIKRIKFVKYHRATAVSDSPMHRSDDEGKFRG